MKPLNHITTFAFFFKERRKKNHRKFLRKPLTVSRFHRFILGHPKLFFQATVLTIDNCINRSEVFLRPISNENTLNAVSVIILCHVISYPCQKRQLHCSFSFQLGPKKQWLCWRNGLLKNRVGRSVIFFFYPAVCPFYTHMPCVQYVNIFIKHKKYRQK